MPKLPPIDHLLFDDEPTEVEPRPRGAAPEELELVEAEPVALEVGAVTDKSFGKGPKNEDAVLVDERSDTYGVLDGMGGAAAGEIASSRASEFIREELVKMPEGIKHDGQQVADYLRSAIVQANGKLMIMVEADPNLKGMGTTCSIMHVLKGPDGTPQELITAQVGDSRVYRLRSGKLERITTDHSLIQQMIDTGHRIDGQPLPSDADQVGDPEVDARMTDGQRSAVMQFRNTITKAIGHPNIEVGVTRTPIEDGDEFIAISDGIGDCLTDREIEAIAQQHSGDPVRISEALVAASQERVKTKDMAKQAGQAVDALTNRGKDDDRSAVAIRIMEQSPVPRATVEEWRGTSDDRLLEVQQEYQKILDAYARDLRQSQWVSKARGMRRAYEAAPNDAAREAIVAKDSAFKRAALDTIDDMMIARHVPPETLAQLETIPTSDLEGTAAEYRTIIDAYARGVRVRLPEAISRAHGMREAYKTAKTDAQREEIIRRDWYYKLAALTAIQRILAARTNAGR